jgi:hypothetical protein
MSDQTNIKVKGVTAIIAKIPNPPKMRLIPQIDGTVDSIRADEVNKTAIVKVANAKLYGHEIKSSWKPIRFVKLSTGFHPIRYIGLGDNQCNAINPPQASNAEIEEISQGKPSPFLTLERMMTAMPLRIINNAGISVINPSPFAGKRY